jgi:hypothetical protein
VPFLWAGCRRAGRPRPQGCLSAPCRHSLAFTLRPRLADSWVEAVSAYAAFAAGEDVLLTTAATCRRQGHRLLDFLVRAVLAHQLGEQPPSLLTLAR